MNPNTGTLPMFRTRDRRRHHPRHLPPAPGPHPRRRPRRQPVGTVVRHGSFTWRTTPGCSTSPTTLADAEFNGWSYERDGKEYVPLYEAKMLSHFDHRFSTYRGATQAQLNVGSLPRLTDKEHDDPDLEPLARYWVDRTEVAAQTAGRVGPRLAAAAGETSHGPATSRTFVPSVLPRYSCG